MPIHNADGSVSSSSSGISGTAAAQVVEVPKPYPVPIPGPQGPQGVPGQVPPLSGDVEGRQDSNTIRRLQGKTLELTGEKVGDAITWDGKQYRPATPLGGTAILGQNQDGAVVEEHASYVYNPVVGVNMFAPASVLVDSADPTVIYVGDYDDWDGVTCPNLQRYKIDASGTIIAADVIDLEIASGSDVFGVRAFAQDDDYLYASLMIDAVVTSIVVIDKQTFAVVGWASTGPDGFTPLYFCADNQGFLYVHRPHDGKLIKYNVAADIIGQEPGNETTYVHLQTDGAKNIGGMVFANDALWVSGAYGPSPDAWPTDAGSVCRHDKNTLEMTHSLQNFGDSDHQDAFGITFDSTNNLIWVSGGSDDLGEYGFYAIDTTPSGPSSLAIVKTVYSAGDFQDPSYVMTFAGGKVYALPTGKEGEGRRIGVIDTAASGSWDGAYLDPDDSGFMSPTFWGISAVEGVVYGVSPYSINPPYINRVDFTNPEQPVFKDCEPLSVPPSVEWSLRYSMVGGDVRGPVKFSDVGSLKGAHFYELASINGLPEVLDPSGIVQPDRTPWVLTLSRNSPNLGDAGAYDMYLDEKYNVVYVGTNQLPMAAGGVIPVTLYSADSMDAVLPDGTIPEDPRGYEVLGGPDMNEVSRIIADDEYLYMAGKTSGYVAIVTRGTGRVTGYIELPSFTVGMDTALETGLDLALDGVGNLWVLTDNTPQGTRTINKYNIADAVAFGLPKDPPLFSTRAAHAAVPVAVSTICYGAGALWAGGADAVLRKFDSTGSAQGTLASAIYKHGRLLFLKNRIWASSLAKNIFRYDPALFPAKACEMQSSSASTAVFLDNMSYDPYTDTLLASDQAYVARRFSAEPTGSVAYLEAFMREGPGQGEPGAPNSVVATGACGRAWVGWAGPGGIDVYRNRPGKSTPVGYGCHPVLSFEQVPPSSPGSTVTPNYSYDIQATDRFVLSSGGSWNHHLPSTTTVADRMITIKDTDGSASPGTPVSAWPQNGGFMDGVQNAAVQITAPYGSVTVLMRSTNNWVIVGRS